VFYKHNWGNLHDPVLWEKIAAFVKRHNVVVTAHDSLSGGSGCEDETTRPLPCRSNWLVASRE
jgi:hypothetical protein